MHFKIDFGKAKSARYGYSGNNLQIFFIEAIVWIDQMSIRYWVKLVLFNPNDE